MSKVLSIKCEELVSIPAGMGFYNCIVFNPTPETKQSIRDAARSGDYYDVDVSDNGGKHTGVRMQRVVSVKSERGVTIAMMQEV